MKTHGKPAHHIYVSDSNHSCGMANPDWSNLQLCCVRDWSRWSSIRGCPAAPMDRRDTDTGCQCPDNKANQSSCWLARRHVRNPLARWLTPLPRLVASVTAQYRQNRGFVTSLVAITSSNTLVSKAVAFMVFGVAWFIIKSCCCQALSRACLPLQLQQAREIRQDIEKHTHKYPPATGAAHLRQTTGPPPSQGNT